MAVVRNEEKAPRPPVCCSLLLPTIHRRRRRFHSSLFCRHEQSERRSFFISRFRLPLPCCYAVCMEGKKVELDLICFMYAWNCFNFFLHSLSDYASACVLRLCAGFYSLFFPAFLMRHPTAAVSRLLALSLDFNIAKFSAKNNDLRRDDIEFGSELCTTSLSHYVELEVP